MAKVHPSIFVLLAVFVAIVAAGVYAFPAVKEGFNIRFAHTPGTKKPDECSFCCKNKNMLGQSIFNMICSKCKC
jgi:hypothetical protein